MAITKYIKLCSLKISHQYYKDGICRDFEIAPTPECAELLKENSLRLRFLSDKVEIYYKAFSDNSPYVAATDIPDGTRFTFTLKLKNPTFLYYSALGTPPNDPHFPGKKEILYFDTDAGNPAPGAWAVPISEINLLPGVRPVVSDLLLKDTPSVIGYAAKVTDSTANVLNPLNAIGSDTVKYATFDSSDNYLVLELMDFVPTGTAIKIYMNSTGGDSNITIESSPDLISYSTLAASHTLISEAAVILSYPLPGPGARYIRITSNPGGLGKSVLNMVFYLFVSAKQTIASDFNIPVTLPRNSSIVSFKDTDGGDPSKALTISTTDPDGNVFPDLTVSSNGTHYVTQIDLSGKPDGKYTFVKTIGGGAPTPSEVYVSNHLNSGEYFGVIEIRKSAIWNEVQSNPAQNPFAYTLNFSSRKSIWRYFVVQKTYGTDISGFEVRDDLNPGITRFPRMKFEDRTADYLPSLKFQGYPARVFVSVYDETDDGISEPKQPEMHIHFLEEANPEINLYKSSGFNELVINNLPKPRLDSVEIVRIGPGLMNLFSDAYIYV